MRARACSRSRPHICTGVPTSIQMSSPKKDMPRRRPRTQVGRRDQAHRAACPARRPGRHRRRIRGLAREAQTNVAGARGGTPRGWLTRAPKQRGSNGPGARAHYECARPRGATPTSSTHGALPARLAGQTKTAGGAHQTVALGRTPRGLAEWRLGAVAGADCSCAEPWRATEAASSAVTAKPVFGSSAAAAKITPSTWPFGRDQRAAGVAAADQRPDRVDLPGHVAGRRRCPGR